MFPILSNLALPTPYCGYILGPTGFLPFPPRSAKLPLDMVTSLNRRQTTRPSATSNLDSHKQFQCRIRRVPPPPFVASPPGGRGALRLPPLRSQSLPHTPKHTINKSACVLYFITQKLSSPLSGAFKVVNKMNWLNHT